MTQIATIKQFEYLRAMLDGPQPNFGKGRVRCHNVLIANSLAKLNRENDTVEITDAGKRFANLGAPRCP